jgi:hypothetical protein
MQSNNEVKKTLKFTRDAAVIGAAVGSVPVVYIVAQGAAMNYTGLKWLSVIIGLLTVALFAAVVEYGMKVYFPYGIKGILSGRAFQEGWRTSSLFLIITALGCAMMYSSGYMSFEGRKEAANLVAGETGTKDIETISANVANNETQLLRIARSEKAAATKAVKDRVQEIRKANGNLTKLEAEGNTWASNKMHSVLSKDKKLQSLEAELNQKSEAVTKLLSNSSVSKVAETISAENVLKLEQWQQRNQTSRALVGLFGIACIIIFALSSTLLVLFELVEEPKAELKTSPDQLVPVSGSSATLERKLNFALKQGQDNRSEIEQIKRSKASEIRTANRPEPSEIIITDNRPRTVADATEHVRTCKQCGTDITHKRSDAKFCTAKCRKTYHEHKNG